MLMISRLPVEILIDSQIKKKKSLNHDFYEFCGQNFQFP